MTAKLNAQRARREFLENGKGEEFFFSHCGETWGVCKEFAVIVTNVDGILTTTFRCPTCEQPMTVSKAKQEPSHA